MSDPTTNNSQSSSANNNAVFETVNGANTNYNPGAVQDMIHQFFATHQGNLTSYQLACVMYMMQEYGAQVTGVQANVQGAMNKYMDQIRNLWSDFYAADNSSCSGTSGQALTSDFLTTIATMTAGINNDAFFNQAGNSGMKQTLLTTLDGLAGQVNSAQGTDQNGLFNIWASFQPSIADAALWLL